MTEERLQEIDKLCAAPGLKWTRDQIMMRLLEIQIGIRPPAGISLEQALQQFRNVSVDRAVAWELGADFFVSIFFELQAKADALPESVAEIRRLRKNLSAQRDSVDDVLQAWGSNIGPARSSATNVALVAAMLNLEEVSKS